MKFKIIALNKYRFYEIYMYVYDEEKVNMI